MALRDGIDTDYDEGDQFEEETVGQSQSQSQSQSRSQSQSQLNIFHNFELYQNSDLAQVEFLIKEEETIIQD